MLAPRGRASERLPAGAVAARRLLQDRPPTRDAFGAWRKGLDVAIVRVVPARPSLDAVVATMRACIGA
jgi:hypothetical protein